jgi:hypothetical protein
MCAVDDRRRVPEPAVQRDSPRRDKHRLHEKDHEPTREQRGVRHPSLGWTGAMSHVLRAHSPLP